MQSSIPVLVVVVAQPSFLRTRTHNSEPSAHLIIFLKPFREVTLSWVFFFKSLFFFPPYCSFISAHHNGTQNRKKKSLSEFHLKKMLQYIALGGGGEVMREQKGD